MWAKPKDLRKIADLYSRLFCFSCQYSNDLSVFSAAFFNKIRGIIQTNFTANDNSHTLLHIDA